MFLAIIAHCLFKKKLYHSFVIRVGCVCLFQYNDAGVCRELPRRETFRLVWVLLQRSSSFSSRAKAACKSFCASEILEKLSSFSIRRVGALERGALSTYVTTNSQRSQLFTVRYFYRSTHATFPDFAPAMFFCSNIVYTLSLISR